MFSLHFGGERVDGPYARTSHVLTGKCKTRANFDRIVSIKTFSNATFPLSCG